MKRREFQRLVKVGDLLCFGGHSYVFRGYDRCSHQNQAVDCVGCYGKIIYGDRSAHCATSHGKMMFINLFIIPKNILEKELFEI